MIPTYQATAIPVISLRPDWARPVKLVQRYATTITEALDTTEERQCRQPRCLYAIEYTTLFLSTAETAYLRRVVETAGALPVACPLWPLSCKLTVAASVGATALTVDDSTVALFDVFHQFAILWQDYDHWEIVELDTVGTTAVTLLAALADDYAVGAELLPLAYGHVPRGPVEQLTDEQGTWECKFEERFHRLHDQSVPEDAP